MPEGKFVRVDRYLRIAVGLEFPELPAGVSATTPGVADIRPYAGRNSQKVYLDLEKAGISPEKIEVRVPKLLGKVLWGEILLNNNRAGAQVLFGREGEEMPFGPTEENRYVILRLYRQSEHPFKTVYVRVDKRPETRFFALKARWKRNTITIEIEREPEKVPNFLA